MAEFFFETPEDKESEVLEYAHDRMDFLESQFYVTASVGCIFTPCMGFLLVMNGRYAIEEQENMYMEFCVFELLTLTIGVFVITTGTALIAYRAGIPYFFALYNGKVPLAVIRRRATTYYAFVFCAAAILFAYEVRPFHPHPSTVEFSKTHTILGDLWSWIKGDGGD